jgi:hypothetical protein
MPEVRLMIASSAFRPERVVHAARHHNGRSHRDRDHGRPQQSCMRAAASDPFSIARLFYYALRTCIRDLMQCCVRLYQPRDARSRLLGVVLSASFVNNDLPTPKNRTRPRLDICILSELTLVTARPRSRQSPLRRYEHRLLPSSDAWSGSVFIDSVPGCC